MPWCALVAQGANRCLPLSMAFCDAASPYPTLPLPLTLSDFHCLFIIAQRLRASLLLLLIQCWKMSSQILLERILADGLKHKNSGVEAQTHSLHRLYDCQRVCASLSAVMHGHVCACVRVSVRVCPWPRLLSWVTQTPPVMPAYLHRKQE